MTVDPRLWASLVVTLAAGFCVGGCQPEPQRAGTRAAPDSSRGEPMAPAARPQLLVAYNLLHDAEADDYEVFVMELDGSGQRNVSNDPGVDWVYSAWRDRLLMVTDRERERRKFGLYQLRLDGTNPSAVTEFEVRDSWVGVGSDGELVVASDKDGTPDLYLIDLEGTQIRRLTDDPEYDNDPALSPDGGQVVWRSRRSGLDELWVMDLASGVRRQLTHYPDDDPAREEYGYHAGPPRWEASRNLITFSSKREGCHSLYSIRPDGSGLERLTGEHDQIYHSWSPDGRYLAFDGTDGEGNYDIYLRDMETGTTTRLTDSPKMEQGPVFVLRPGAPAAIGTSHR